MNESAPAAKPPQKRKSGFLRRTIRWLVIYPLLLAAAAGGALYAAWQQPQLRPHLQPHWENLAARTPMLRRFIAPPSGKAAQPEAAPEDSSPAANAKPVAAETVAADAPIDSAPGGDSFDDNNGDSANFSDADNAGGAAADSAARELAAQLAYLQNEVAKLRDAPPSRGAPQDIRLSLIDLRLRLDGDAPAAAAALSALRGDAGSANRRLLAAEIARLQNAASREQIADTLRKFSRIVARAASPHSADAAESAAATTGGQIAAGLKRIFNVRRISENNGGGDNETAESAGARLQRMEFLLLTGQREAYLAALNEFAAAPPSVADANAPLLIRALREFGAPEYALKGLTTR